GQRRRSLGGGQADRSRDRLPPLARGRGPRLSAKLRGGALRTPPGDEQNVGPRFGGAARALPGAGARRNRQRGAGLVGMAGPESLASSGWIVLTSPCQLR